MRSSTRECRKSALRFRGSRRRSMSTQRLHSAYLVPYPVSLEGAANRLPKQCFSTKSRQNAATFGSMIAKPRYL